MLAMRMAWLCAILSIFLAVSAAAEQRPNIVFLMADDLGYQDVGFNGNGLVKTPHLDRLAADGIRFTRFYSIGPVCSPTRASCLTGRHYMRMGMMHVNIGKLPEQEITLAHIAKAKGYTTGHFGKWHLGTMSREESPIRKGEAIAAGYGPPWERGYDVTFTTETNIATWDPLDYTGLRIPKHTCTFWSNGHKVAGDYAGSSDKIIMDRAIPFIEAAAQRHQPFLTTIWFYGPHSPVRAGKRLRALYEDLPPGQQHFYGAITAIDEQVGRLRRRLKALEIDDNTLIFFCSDNGPEGDGSPKPDYDPYLGAYYGSAGEFRGRKRWLYNGGVCVPACVVWPGVIAPHQIRHTPASTLDYVPTTMDLLDFDAPVARPLDGMSLLPLLRGNAAWQHEKAIPFASHIGRDSPEVALIRGEYKYCGHWGKPGGGEELYHLLDDPAEANDLAAELPGVIESMRDELARWIVSCRHSYNGGDYTGPYILQGRFLTLANPDKPGRPVPGAKR